APRRFILFRVAGHFPDHRVEARSPGLPRASHDLAQLGNDPVLFEIALHRLLSEAFWFGLRGVARKWRLRVAIWKRTPCRIRTYHRGLIFLGTQQPATDQPRPSPDLERGTDDRTFGERGEEGHAGHAQMLCLQLAKPSQRSNGSWASRRRHLLGEFHESASRQFVLERTALARFRMKSRLCQFVGDFTRYDPRGKRDRVQEDPSQLHRVPCICELDVDPRPRSGYRWPGFHRFRDMPQ